MALGATMYVFDIELANSDRAVYESLELRVARHPSEAPDGVCRITYEPLTDAYARERGLSR